MALGPRFFFILTPSERLSGSLLWPKKMIFLLVPWQSWLPCMEGWKGEVNKARQVDFSVVSCVVCRLPGSDGDDVVREATTAAALVANPVAIASLASLQSTGCPLPAGPLGSVRVLETLSYLVPQSARAP